MSRVLRVALTAVRHGLGHAVDRRRDESGPRRLRQLLEDLGGAYLKFGQLLAVQVDVLPRRYCDALFDLLDRVPPFAYADVERTFVEDLGRPPGEVFEQFEASPFAAASIGQVHRAVDRGRRVAVKVRRPDAETVFEADLRVLATLAQVIETLRMRRLEWLVHMIEELCTWTREELDYRFEARFMDALRFNARHSRTEAVPEVVLDRSTRRILVATYLDGPTALDYIRSLDTHAGSPERERRVDATAFDAPAFARNLVRNFVSDAFRHGLFHADLHPANVLILPGRVVGYVDFGIGGFLSTHTRRELVALTLALTRGDAESIRVHFLRMARLRPWSDAASFSRGLRTLVEEWFAEEDGERRLRASFTTVMVDLLRLSRRTSVWPTPDAVRYMRSMITADGLVARIAPEFDAVRFVEAVCVEQLEGELLASWLSPEAVLDWATTGARVFVRGPSALAALLPARRGAHHETGRRRARRADRHQRSVQLGLVGIAALALAAAGSPPAGLGWNTFTAALAVGGASAVAFLLLARNPT